MALILVLTTLAILTSVGVDFSYSSRVSLRLAENARDELRAYYLARSAVNLSRLLLHFQKQVDQLGGQIAGPLQAALSASGGRPAPAGAPARSGAPPAPGQPRPPAPAPVPAASLGLRLWEIVPVDSNAMGALLGGGDLSALGVERLKAGPERAEREERPSNAPPLSAPLHTFGAFEGSYRAKISDENSKINVAGLANIGLSPVATLVQLRALMADPRFDFIFDEEDANRDRVRRDDVILAMKDWMDEDEVGSALDPTNTVNPFVNAFSDENAAYDRYLPRYKAKNARCDSLDELYMVRGVNDRFMQAFGDRLTVWLDLSAKLNINTNDPLQLVTDIQVAAANPNDPKLRDPRLLQTILQEIQLKKMFSFFGLSPMDFVSVLTQNGIAVKPDFLNPASPNNFFTATSDTFRITATGRVGRIEKKLTAVIKYDELLGKLLYWKEE